jgi:hypothetical protein
MISAMKALLVGVALLGSGFARQSFTRAATAAAENASAVPFGVGETSTFDVKFGGLRVGGGSLQVVGRETLRGREVWHTAFTVEGGVPFYRVDDRYESWFEVGTLTSLAFNRQIEEGRRERMQSFEMHPDKGQYIERTRQKTTTKKTVDDPLDEGAFLYFVRTIPLVVGQTYDFNRYFVPDRNPVRIRVLRKERVTVPAGTFNAIVIQPVIKTRGIFSENGQAEVWLSDDSSRILLQLKSKLSFGSLNLYLKSYTPPTGQRTTRQ